MFSDITEILASILGYLIIAHTKNTPAGCASTCLCFAVGSKTCFQGSLICPERTLQREEWQLGKYMQMLPDAVDSDLVGKGEN